MDELPQFWNVLLGEMSLVGPRPEVPEWVDTFSGAFVAHLRLRPGLSDLASLIYYDEGARLAGAGGGLDLYREDILPHKLKLYEIYARKVSLALDLRIIGLTLTSLVSPRWAADQAEHLVHRLQLEPPASAISDEDRL